MVLWRPTAQVFAPRRMVQEPALRDVFLVKDGGQWRAPKVNETCCRRPALADLLQKGAMFCIYLMYSQPSRKLGVQVGQRKRDWSP